MTNSILFRPARRLFPALVLTVLAGCATAPQAPAPEPVQQPVQALPAPPVQPAPEEPLVLKPDYPERYVVVKGDTLWDISVRFLRDPWRWPELWQNNPQIRNPHLIYPGDVLSLIYIDGKPAIRVQPARPKERYSTVKLSPQVRTESLERAIPTIPVDAIRQFLSQPQVVSQKELAQAPYIVSSADQHLIAGAGHRVYARGIDTTDVAEYAVVRAGKVYRNPDNPEDILGFEATHVGDARVQRFGDPSTLLLTSTKREVLNGDRLLPAAGRGVDQDFIPRAPTHKVDARIISVVDGVSQIGQYQVVVLNLGRQEDVEPGNVLAVYQSGVTVRDPVKHGERVELPRERAGLVMVFRVFERLSYALVMDATRPIHVMDSVTNP